MDIHTKIGIPVAQLGKSHHLVHILDFQFFCLYRKMQKQGSLMSSGKKKMYEARHLRGTTNQNESFFSCANSSSKDMSANSSVSVFSSGLLDLVFSSMSAQTSNIFNERQRKSES